MPRRHRVSPRWASPGLLLAGCQGAPVDRKLDGYIMSSARSAEANHDYGTAAAHYASLYDAAHPDADMAIGMARNLRYAGNAAEAVGALENSLRQLGDRPDLLIELGKQHVAAGKPELAVDPLLQAARLAPSQWEAAHVLGIAYDRMGRHDEARTSYERASVLSPGNAAHPEQSGPVQGDGRRSGNRRPIARTRRGAAVSAGPGPGKPSAHRPAQIG